MSHWTSKYAICRDLSVVQGRVPVALEGTVGAGEKPPSLNITEETEEEFFKHCSADAVVETPDLRQIKEMLKMVQDTDDAVQQVEDCFNKAVIISKLDPHCSDFIPNSISTSAPIDESLKKPGIKQIKEKPRKKRQRNIALESILQAIENAKQDSDVDVLPEPMKLLKPYDFIAKQKIADTFEVDTDHQSTLKSLECDYYKTENEDNTFKPMNAVTNNNTNILTTPANGNSKIIANLECNPSKTLTAMENDDSKCIFLKCDKTKTLKNFKNDSKPVFDLKYDHLKTITGIEKDNKIAHRENISPTVGKKVTDWFETMHESPFSKKTPKVVLEPMNNMFRKKTVTDKVKTVEPAKSPVSISSSEQYQPSTLANEYYQKYIERSRFKESVRDDIWTKAEKKMKEVEEKRRRQLCEALPSPSSTSQTSSNYSDNTEDLPSSNDATTSMSSRGLAGGRDIGVFNLALGASNDRLAKINKCLDTICLPHHRHLFTEECIVCKIILKKSEDIPWSPICSNTTSE